MCRAAEQLQLDTITALPIRCDVSKKAEVEAMLMWTVQQFGGVDILVSNAGIVRGADFLDMTEEDFDDVISVNLKGVFLVWASIIPRTVTESPVCHDSFRHANCVLLQWQTHESCVVSLVAHGTPNQANCPMLV